jgi:Leucine-rich repeat (LRR) protein
MIPKALHEKKEAYHLAKELVQNIKTTIDAVERSKKIWCSGLSTWLRQLNDMAYDVEDMLDNIEFHFICNKVHRKRKFREFSLSQIFGKPVYLTLGAVKSWLFPQSDMEKLSTLSNRFHTFLLTANSFMDLLDNAIESQREITNPFSPHVTNFVGRTIVKEELKIQLQTNKGTNRVDVIPLIGIGGIGKTALAQNLYHEVQEFELRGWLQLSDSTDIIMAIRDLVQYFGDKIENLPDNITLNNPFKILSQTVNAKKFFLVLDDVRDNIEDQWNNLIVALNFGASGSKILITTRCHKIAKRIGTVRPINLDVLGPEDLLTLFEYHALGGVQIEEENKRVLRLMSNKIVTNLCGLPLAAKIIGNLLRSNLNEREWRRVSELKWWNIKEALDGILPSLVTGYQQLEAGQKKCFTYCCIFPKDHMFQKERVVQMWIANDFIQSNDQERVTMEDIGRQWFDDLVEKSFIQQGNDDNQFIMNDLMQGLATVVSTDNSLSLTEESSIPSTTRHLALSTSKIDLLCDIERSSNLRTIILSAATEINPTNMPKLNSVFNKLECLRVLQLSRIRMEHLPDGITYLPHLRYLDLSYTGIRYLHKSICMCCHLQVLDILGCNLKSLPAGITDLINLRHLYADTRTVSLISGIGELENLQELNEFHIRNERGYKITELKNMRFLRGGLRIMGIENVSSTEEAREANLIEKNLDLLGFYQEPSNRPDFSREILEALHPHPNLKELIISGYEGSLLPNWFPQLTSIQKLTVEKCPQLEALQPHPNLRELIISGYEGSLLPNWLQQLTSIQKITIENCPQLQSMVRLPPVLDELAINGCSENLMEQCRPNRAQWLNIRHVQRIFVHGEQIR